MAAVHRDDVRPISRDDEANVGGTRALCREATTSGINRIVFASSVAFVSRSSLKTRPSSRHSRTNISSSPKSHWKMD
ncbi:MAG: hypothetical protein JKY00_07975 [Roseicyclus sp.]|nr:hypothetical protein [Roseicyclus sp.]